MSVFNSVYADDAQCASYIEWRQKQLNAPEYSSLNPIQARHHLALSGTTASTLLRVNPWQTPDELIEYINWRLPEKPQSFAMARGSAMEDTIRMFAVNRLKMKNVRKDVNYNAPEYPERSDEAWCTAQVDTEGEMPDGSTAILEIKTASRNHKVKGRNEWGRGCKFNDKGDLLKEDAQIPTHYLAQVQWQMGVSGIRQAFVAVHIDGDTEPRIFHIPYDKDMCETLFHVASTMMFEHIIPDKPLTEKPIAKVTKALPVPEAEPEYEQAMTYQEFSQDKVLKTMYEEYQCVKEEQDKLKKRLEALTSSIKDRIGTHDAVMGANGKAIITRTVYKRSTLDTKAFSNAYPSIYKSFLRESVVERFNIK